MKLFKNKFLGLLACIAIFAVVFYSALGLLGKASLFQNTLGVIATPFRVGFNAIGEVFGGFGDYVPKDETT